MGWSRGLVWKKTNSSTGFFPIQGNCKSEKGEKETENSDLSVLSFLLPFYSLLRLPYRGRKPVEEFVFCHTSPLLQPNPRLSLKKPGLTFTRVVLNANGCQATIHPP